MLYIEESAVFLVTNTTSTLSNWWQVKLNVMVLTASVYEMFLSFKNYDLRQNETIDFYIDHKT